MSIFKNKKSKINKDDSKFNEPQSIQVPKLKEGFIPSNIKTENNERWHELSIQLEEAMKAGKISQMAWIYKDMASIRYAENAPQDALFLACYSFYLYLTGVDSIERYNLFKSREDRYLRPVVTYNIISYPIIRKLRKEISDDEILNCIDQVGKEALLTITPITIKDYKHVLSLCFDKHFDQANDFLEKKFSSNHKK